VHLRLAPLGVVVSLVAGLAACTTSPGVTVSGARPAVTTGVSTSADPTSPSTSLPAGSDGIGDSLFPPLGNPGIDVRSYDVHLDVDPAKNHLSGTVKMEIAFTAARSSFTLDANGPQVTAVTVDGITATFAAQRPELRIALPTPVRAGDDRVVEVTYTADPAPGRFADGVPVGWFSTPAGSWAQNEPNGASTWLPCDDHPSDKADYTFAITVPAGFTAVANGELVDHRADGGRVVWRWSEPHPMATYLIQVLTGHYDIVEGTGPHGLPLLSVVLHDDRTRMQKYFDSIGDEISWFETQFGPYPFSRYGLAFTDSQRGLAVEMQERSLFSRYDFMSGRLGENEQSLLSHELAHQWFGDAVTPSRWSDIWLNESFATYAQWMWLEHAGFTSVSEAAQLALTRRPPGATGLPSLGEMFGVNSYEGGAVVLHALRRTIGDRQFFEVLRRWVADNNGMSRSTADFIHLAEVVSGKSLQSFFSTWLYASQVPTKFPDAGV
jgi:aminopeptidase N